MKAGNAAPGPCQGGLLAGSRRLNATNGVDLRLSQLRSMEAPQERCTYLRFGQISKLLPDAGASEHDGRIVHRCSQAHTVGRCQLAVSFHEQARYGFRRVAHVALSWWTSFARPSHSAQLERYVQSNAGTAATTDRTSRSCCSEPLARRQRSFASTRSSGEMNCALKPSSSTRRRRAQTSP